MAKLRVIYSPPSIRVMPRKEKVVEEETTENQLMLLLAGSGLDPDGIKEVVSQLVAEERIEVSRKIPEKPTTMLGQQEWALRLLCERVDELFEEGCDPMIMVSSAQATMAYVAEQVGGLEGLEEEDGN